MTSSAPNGNSHSPLGAVRLGLARERALIALFDLGRKRKKGFGLRAAKLYAFGVCLSSAIVIWLTHGSDRRAQIQSALEAALVSLSWVVGALAALGTARGLAEHTESAALRALAVRRGFSHNAVSRARTLAAAWRVAQLIGIPGLLLVGVALARGQSLAWACLTAPAVAIYAALLGLGLAVLAHFSAEASPRHARALLASLVFVPLLLSAVYPAIPSISGAVRALLTGLLGPGAALS